MEDRPEVAKAAWVEVILVQPLELRHGLSKLFYLEFYPAEREVAIERFAGACRPPARGECGGKVSLLPFDLFDDAPIGVHLARVRLFDVPSQIVSNRLCLEEVPLPRETIS